jgi:putative glycosyl hydrolase-like family 15 (GHL15) protein
VIGVIRRIGGFGAAVLLVVAAVAAIPRGDVVAASGTATTPNALLRWASTNGGGNAAQKLTQAQAVADARNHDWIVALIKTFPPYLSAMRAANPALKMFAYLNGAYAQSSQGTLYPAAWYAHDAKGNQVKSRAEGNFLMDVSNPAWVTSRVQTCADYVQQSGYDGCYLDMLGNASVDTAYVTAAPVNKATGKPWTVSDWMTATAQLGSAVSKANPSLLVVGNGLSNGDNYFAAAEGPTSKLLNGLDGANAQGFIRSEGAAITKFRSAAQWKEDVDMLVDAGRRGKSVLAMTKVGVRATAAQLTAVHRYALASFLLGTDGHQYFFFDSDGRGGAVADDTPDDHVVVGTPTGAYKAVAGGAYTRTFTAGLAVVNPTAASVVVSLGGTYKNLDGVSSSSVTMPPYSGNVFTLAS